MASNHNAALRRWSSYATVRLGLVRRRETYAADLIAAKSTDAR
jgi:hypothetical protein